MSRSFVYCGRGVAIRKAVLKCLVAVAPLAVIAAGCAVNSDTERASPEDEAALDKAAQIARAELHGVEAVGDHPREYEFTGPVGVTVELARQKHRYTLTVESAADEPYIVVVATSSCGKFARTGGAGKTVYVKRGLPDAHAGEDRKRHVIAIDRATADSLTARPLTVFADSRGAHIPDYIYCGPLERNLWLSKDDRPALPTPRDDAQASTWIRDNLERYEREYLDCRYAANPRSGAYTDPALVYRMRIHDAREAAGISASASWVAWTACTNGIADTPWPIPELAHLRP